MRAGYASYQFWDTVQALCSYLRGVLTTKALLEGSGVGSRESLTDELIDIYRYYIYYIHESPYLYKKVDSRAQNVVRVCVAETASALSAAINWVSIHVRDPSDPSCDPLAFCNRLRISCPTIVASVAQIL